MSPLEDRPDSSQSARGRRLVANLAWLGLGVLLTWGLLANPLGLSSLDGLRHRLLGDRPVPARGGGSEDAQKLWTCPMHPEVVEDGPGQCPICHMDLVPKVSDEWAGAPSGGESQLWTCGMHPQIVEDEPGQCPICGMDLVPLRQEATPSGRTASEATGDRTVLFYRNPMDPTITSPVPAKDEMGMDYVPVYADEAAAGPTVTIDPAVVQNMNVVTEEVKRGDLSREIRTVGYLEYDQQKMVTVTTKYPGWIEKVYVNYVGEPVAKGAPLFEIYSPELVQTEQDLLSAIDFAGRMENATEDARRRAENLVEASRQRLDYWDVTPEQIRRLEETGKVFRTLTVVAPAGGVVMKRMPGLEGMATRPGMELFHIADLSSLWLSVEAFEDQIAWLRVGSEAKVSLSYFPGEAFVGRVRYIEPQVNEKTRTVPLKLEVPNPRGRLRAGMYATVEFDPVMARDAVLVPRLAVLRTGQRNLVIVALGEGRFAPREVELGPEGEREVGVRSGLNPGERVVTSAQFLIDSESNLQEAVQKLLAARQGGESGEAQPAHRH